MSDIQRWQVIEQLLRPLPRDMSPTWTFAAVIKEADHVAAVAAARAEGYSSGCQLARGEAVDEVRRAFDELKIAVGLSFLPAMAKFAQVFGMCDDPEEKS